jgi:nitrate reductase NapE component
MTTSGIIMMSVSLVGVWGLLFWCYREILKD